MVRISAFLLSLACATAAVAQEACQTYRLVYQTVYDQQQVTAYRIETETVYDEQQQTAYRPVYETEMRESRYMVARPVAETSETFVAAALRTMAIPLMAAASIPSPSQAVRVYSPSVRPTSDLLVRRRSFSPSFIIAICDNYIAICDRCQWGCENIFSNCHPCA